MSHLDDSRYLIWSNEHRMWWRPNSAGYTRLFGMAGVYSAEDAIRICARGRDGWASNEPPSEIPVREADVRECVKRDLRRRAPEAHGQVGQKPDECPAPEQGEA